MFDLLTGWAVAKGLGKPLAWVEKTHFQQNIRAAYLEWIKTAPRPINDEDASLGLAFLDQRDDPPTLKLLHTIATAKVPNQYQWEQYFIAIWHSVKLVTKSKQETFFTLPEPDAITLLQDLATRVYNVYLQDDSLQVGGNEEHLDFITQLISHQFSILHYEEQRLEIENRINQQLKSSSALNKAPLYDALQILQEQYRQLDACYQEKLQQLSHTHHAMSQLQTLFDYGDYESAQASLMTGDTRECSRLFEQAINAAQSKDHQKALAHYQLGILARDDLDYVTASQHFDASVRLQRENPVYSTTSGILQHEMHQYNLAVESFRHALSLYETQPGTDASVAFLQHRLGQSLAQRGDWDEAIVCFEAALAIDIVQGGEYQVSVATTYHHLAQAHSSRQNFDKAIHYYDKAIKIDQFIQGPRHRNIATELTDLGHAFMGNRQYDKAIASYDKALDILTNQLPYQHPDIALLLHLLGDAWSKQDNAEKALFFYKKALDVRRELFNSAHADTIATLNSLTELYLKIGDYNNAVDFGRQTVDASSALYGDKSPNLIGPYMNLASCWLNKGDNDQGILICETALEITLNYYGENHELYGKLWSYVGYAYTGKSDFKVAIQSYEKSILVLNEVLGDNHPYTVSVANALNLARKHQAQTALN